MYENTEFVLKINLFCKVCKIHVGGSNLVIRLVVGGRQPFDSRVVCDLRLCIMLNQGRIIIRHRLGWYTYFLNFVFNRTWRIGKISLKFLGYHSWVCNNTWTFHLTCLTIFKTYLNTLVSETHDRVEYGLCDTRRSVCRRDRIVEYPIKTLRVKYNNP